MSPDIRSIRQIVLTVLNECGAARDCKITLIREVWKRQIGCATLDGYDAEDILNGTMTGNLGYPHTIVRRSQEFQKDFKMLRGKQWGGNQCHDTLRPEHYRTGGL